ncbi:Terminase small subunit [Hymenobacter gelipurpurascens]|uniref:Terminase small subunit n=1 Tax=Hymenobacter gelipurpurascens TaxID=89968 RepID=A0A212T8K5_9BACT|nr:terminase small subunit [Hymenobacter gelipurpurascens]SNC62345.1 Terminase small subunit [Hymenobacter gelipurpurascens]
MATGQPDESTTAAHSDKPLSHNQRRFAQFYALLWKGAPAARMAGYSEATAKQQATNMLADERIKAAVLEEAAKLHMSPEEAAARMAGWARVSMSDLLRFEEEPHTPRIMRPISELYEEVEQEIEFEDEYARRAGYSKKEMKMHRSKLVGLRRRLLRYEIIMQKDPDAKELSHGKTVMRKVAHVDLQKAKELHQLGAIKSYKPTRSGWAVELHDAKDATDKILKLLGAYAPVKVDHTTNGNDMPGSNIMMPDNGRD